MDERHLQQIVEAIGTPSAAAKTKSQQRVRKWFAETAPLIQWDVIDSPLGPLYLATSPQGLCNVDFGVSQTDFVNRLDPLAHAEQNPAALATVAAQLRAYFAGDLFQFDFPLDLDRVTPFQKDVLQTTRRIPRGTVWTYGQVARTIGKPKASQAVGQALGRNPIPIVVPCHRVIASDGGLGGYSGGGGLESKKLLLKLEGAVLV